MKLSKRILVGILCAGLGMTSLPTAFVGTVKAYAVEAQTDIELGTNVTGALDEDGVLTITVPSDGGTLDNTLFTTWTESYGGSLTAIKMAEENGTLYLPSDSSFLFAECTNLVSIDTSAWDTSNVTNMQYMFRNCAGLESIELSGFNTENVTNLGGMFRGCAEIESLDLSSFDTSKVTDMSYMFRACSTLTSLDLSGFNTSNVKNMGTMFGDCTRLESVNVSSFDTSKVTDLSYMFDFCNKLTTIDVSGFNTEHVQNMSAMFRQCISLGSIDVSSFDTSYVKDFSVMFAYCNGLTSLDLSSFDISSANYADGMFYECNNLQTIKTPKSTSDCVSELPGYYETTAGTVYTELPSELSTSVLLTKSNIKNATISLSKKSYTYTGKAIKPEVTVKLGNITLTQGTDYTVSYSNNKKVGTATVTVKAKNTCSGTVKKTFVIKKATNTLKVKAKKVNVKYSKIKEKSLSLNISKVLSVSKNKGKVTYSKISGNSKITINKKTGRITIKKGLTKGLYKVKIKVTATGNSKYKSKTVTKIGKIKVK